MQAICKDMIQLVMPLQKHHQFSQKKKLIFESKYCLISTKTYTTSEHKPRTQKKQKTKKQSPVTLSKF